MIKNKSSNRSKSNSKKKTKPPIKKSKLIKIKSSKIKKEKVKKVKKEKIPKKVESINKIYFDQSTEDAIELYNNTESQDIRETIYHEKIKYPFEKLVENVFNTFKFSYFETASADVQKETVTHLVANIQKYEKGKGKAFSYFSIVAKHYLIFLNNSNYRRFNQSVEIGEERDGNMVQLQSEDKYYKEREMSEFMKLMITYWENNIGKIFNKQRDLNIANAVVELFRNSDRISLFCKKALYLYIREISDCKTQQITKIINKMKSHYVNIQQKYVDTGII